MIFGNPYLLAGIAASAFAGGYWLADTVGENKYLQLEARYAKQYQDAVDQKQTIELLQDEVARIVAEKAAIENQEAKVVEKIITKKVIEYVQTNPPACSLNADWVRVHDTAASGSLPEDTNTTTATNDTTDEVEALVAVTDNYSTCNANARQLRQLQDWVREVLPSGQ